MHEHCSPQPGLIVMLESGYASFEPRTCSTKTNKIRIVNKTRVKSLLIGNYSHVVFLLSNIQLAIISYFFIILLKFSY